MPFSYTEIVSGPPEEAFRLAWDLDAQRKLDPRILKYEKLEPGPLKVGDHLSLAGAFYGSLGTSTKVILEYDDKGPPFTSVTEEYPGMGMKVRCESRYEACPEGTKITLDYAVRPRHILGALMWPLMMLVWAFVFPREVRGWAERLEQGLEHRRVEKDEEAASAPQVHGMTSAGRCPYCHDDTDVHESVACASCMSRHHADCWDELGECASCGARVRFTATEETGGRARPERPGVKE